MQRIGANFQEFDSDSNAMVILEGEQPLGADAHHYYDELIKAFEADPEHIEHVADFWGDPLTASGAQSNDGKSAYVQLYLRGNMGETLANESVAAVRDIVEKTPAPPGVKAYVTGGAALISDQRARRRQGQRQGHARHARASSRVMLLIVYRSIATMVLILLMVFIELGAARGIVAFLGDSGIIGLSTFATSLLTLMVIAAGTDYAIFLIGRYQEARGARRGPGNRVLHHVSRHRARRAWFGPDHRRRDAVPELHAAAVLPDHGRCRARSAYSSRSSPR